MAHIAVFISFIVCLCNVYSLNLPGPLVYVVTPSPHPPGALGIDEGRSAPFYYHNWMRRMDSPQNASSTTTTTTTTTAKVDTPDLIFAEFESHNGDNYRKSLRNLLAREKIEPKTSTTTMPIYVPDNVPEQKPQVNYVVPDRNKEEKLKASTPDKTDYFALYNNMYGNNDAAPVYVPTSTRPASVSTTSTSTTTTAVPMLNNVHDIWHVIDSEKHNQLAGQWEEVPIDSESDQVNIDSMKAHEKTQKEDKDKDIVDDNFALPGFGTNPGNGAENESRAIRTEPNIRFPYINLKPFQVKNSFANSKKTNNGMFTNLDNFHEIANPVRGEAQDVMPFRQPIDRYNPAQPYLPPTKYGIKQKESNSDSPPAKTVANLVPPPPPPPPLSSGNDFPAPNSYESFPPFAPVDTNPAPPPPATATPALPPRPSAPKYQPPMDTPTYDSPPDDGDSDRPPVELGYRYKPAAPVKPFLPTLPPLSKPFKGYSYDKPAMPMDYSPVMDKPQFNGYHYKKPEPAAPPNDDEPSPSYDHPPGSSYGHHGPPLYQDSDYPELIFNKPPGGDDSKAGGDNMKGNDMGMMPPPPPPNIKPDMDNSDPHSDDHGFPSDFPGDFKYHHDFDDHDFYHHHHHHPTTTTTTTTEMPRVNRYSYYYLGKKLYYLPLYFSVYFIVYVGALIIKAVLRHKIVYPNSFRPNDQTAGFLSKRSVDSWDLSNENLHEITGKVTAAIGKAAEKYMDRRSK